MALDTKPEPFYTDINLLIAYYLPSITAKGPLPEMVRGTQRHSSGPGFDSPWERISG